MKLLGFVVIAVVVALVRSAGRSSTPRPAPPYRPPAVGSSPPLPPAPLRPGTAVLPMAEPAPQTLEDDAFAVGYLLGRHVGRHDDHDPGPWPEVNDDLHLGDDDCWDDDSADW